MIADLNDGSGPVLIKYIRIRGSSSFFFVNEVFCYELPRVLPTDIIKLEGRASGANLAVPTYV